MTHCVGNAEKPPPTHRRSDGSPRFSPRAHIPRAALAALVVFTALLGVYEPVDRALMDWRFKLLERPASQSLVLVEIDPRSIAEAERWPWSRERYAQAIENLQHAGADLVGFDVDFSSRADASGDAAFAEALANRPGDVILPTFSQWSSSSGEEAGIMEIKPNPLFLNDTTVASVTLTAETNGAIRRGWKGFENNGAYRASMASVLAEQAGAEAGQFYIDFSVDPATIPRLSFQDILENEFAPGDVAGKKILVGATALELGDEFVIPVHGVTPGVVIHALSYESLLQGRALMRPNFGASIILAAFVIMLLGGAGNRRSALFLFLSHSAVFVVALAAPILVQATAPVSINMGAAFAAQFFCIVHLVARRLHGQALQILQHRKTIARFQTLTGLIVRETSDGLVVTDEKGVVELCNARAQELLGLRNADVVGVNLAALAPGFPLYDDFSALGSDRAFRNAEYLAPNNKGLIIEVVADSSVTPHAHGKNTDAETSSVVFVYTLRDISARKRIEEAEAAAKEAAIAASNLKTQLISNMSHELRTPLNGIIGFSDILRKESYGPLGTEEYKEYTDHIYVSGHRLLQVVNNMLTISRLDAGEFELDKEWNSLREIVGSAIDVYEDEVSSDLKQISAIVPDDMPALFTDYSVFKEIISHFLSNAVKFTDTGDEIVLRAALDGEDLTIEVTDSGCGVDRQFLPKLTEAFYQVESEMSRAHEGAGLGLFVASKLVELHGGELLLESEKGVGFTARMRFPKIGVSRRRNAA